MNHTPGPWKWEDQVGYFALIGSNGEEVIDDGSAAGEYPGMNITCPDARLIAAAPELLEALVIMLRGDQLGEYECQKQGFPRLSERRSKARAAISKAKGEK